MHELGDVNASYTCFFYGTLMSVDILRRVIGTSSSHLEFADALLQGYTRHHIKGVDYPAVVPAKEGTSIIGRTLTDEEASVRGTVVKGLTASDLRFLDTFEGDEYARCEIQAKLLSDWRTTAPNSKTPILSSDTLVHAQIYIWIASKNMLEANLWSYEEFLRDKAHAWIGNSRNEREYVEVDRRRQMEGKIVHGAPETTVPEFGHKMREEHFTFEKGFINLNHGGVGAAPKAVQEARRKWQDLVEQAPDKFFRKEYYNAIGLVRDRCAEVLNCSSGELAYVLNATTGVNIVLRSIRWQKGDRILYFPNAIYGACYNTLLYVRDRHEGVQLVPVDFTFPESHASIVQKTRKVIEETVVTLGPNEQIRLGLMDAICSKPGAVMPWIELCALFREYGILSLVDAAHMAGQMPVDLEKSQPDFWVSNAHKWYFAPRSVAIFYVPKRNHHLIETFPTSFGYVSSRQAKTAETVSSFTAEFSYTGTQDVSNLLAIPAALDFRLKCGGDNRIMDYNHKLVTEGAGYLAKALETEVMQNEEGNLIAAMANVRLPLDHVPQAQQAALAHQLDLLLLDEYNITAGPYSYDGKLWIRIAAQIYNEISDYHELAEALQKIFADDSRFAKTD